MSQHRAQARSDKWVVRVPGHAALGIVLLSGSMGFSQDAPPAGDALEARLRQLTEAMSQAQKQIDQSERELEQLRGQVAALQEQLAEAHSAGSGISDAARLSQAVDQIREQQTLEEAQIATHEQAKVESESKYRLKLSGLVLLNGFVNTAQVDDPGSPSIVLSGGGSTGASLRQTVVGLDAEGPHILNARTRADLRIDFYGASSSNNNASVAYSGGLARLRTAHAELAWDRTRVFFSLDHPIVAPNTPASLTAVAIPALGWSGNLWTWNPQVGLSGDIGLSSEKRFRLEGALIDVMNPAPIYGGSGTSMIQTPTTAEMSRWPGVEGRMALLSGNENNGLQLGVGGLFAPHRSIGGTRFNSWAGTLDYRVPLTTHAELSGSGYWGEALGGLGGGGFKDYVFGPDPLSPTGYSFKNLHAIGGWTQFKVRAREQLEFNAAIGTDQVPAFQLRPYAGNDLAYYLNLARNRTYTGNVIYRPSAYLLFSLEYRHIESSPVDEYTSTGDVIGIATGYRF